MTFDEPHDSKGILHVSSKFSNFLDRFLPIFPLPSYDRLHNVNKELNKVELVPVAKSLR